MTAQTWWGTFEFSEGQIRCWKTDDRRFVIQRLQSEWLTWNIESEEEGNTPVEQTVLDTEPADIDNKKIGRLLQQSTSAKIKVYPALADRSFVSRPRNVLRLPGGEKTDLLVSTPLWFRAQLEDGTDLLDLPFWRPSDSWFGNNNMEGELCYAKKTDALLQSEFSTEKYCRAVTPIHIDNKSKDVLQIERINLPVPLLNMYFSDNQLWTEKLSIVREESGQFAQLKLDNHAPNHLKNAEHLGAARERADNNKLIRSLSSLFA